MRVVRHRQSSEHLKVCPECRRRLEFMRRVGTEAYLIANELEMNAEEAVRTLVTLAHNLSEQNGCLDEFVDHLILSVNIIGDAKRPPRPH